MTAPRLSTTPSAAPRRGLPSDPTVAPLWPLGAAAAWLRRPEPRVMSLLEEGRLPWAWNIARRGAARREIRVWFESLAGFKRAVQGAGNTPAGLDPELPFHAVADAVIGHPRPCLRAVEVCDILHCDRMTVTRHLADGELTPPPLPSERRRRRRRARTGPYASPLISRASLEAFLERRLLG